MPNKVGGNEELAAGSAMSSSGGAAACRKSALDWMRSAIANTETELLVSIVLAEAPYVGLGRHEFCLCFGLLLLCSLLHSVPLSVRWSYASSRVAYAAVQSTQHLV